MRTRCDVLRDLCCRLRPCVARLFAESAARCLEPLSLGLIKFRTWHLRIRKNMKYKSQRSAGEDVWGGPAVLLAPGQARSTPARIFPQSSRTNTTPKSPCKAAGRPVGSACGFLSRTDAGQVRLEPAAKWEPARNVPQPPPFRRRASLSDDSSRSGRIPRGCSRHSQLCVELLPAWCPGCSRVVEPNNIALVRIALLTARFDSP